MNILYYDSCPNCKNKERNMVREASIQTRAAYDDRFIAALPKIWGEEAKGLGAKMPFLYSPETGDILELDAGEAGMREKVKDFLRQHAEGNSI